MKDIDPNAHIRVLKKTMKVNGETMEANITNLFGFILRENILEWGENFVQDHPNYTFEELEQVFCKCFWIVKNDEKVYMQRRNLQQQVGEQVEVYYGCLLKLANYLPVKATDVFLVIIFIANL